MPPSPRTSHSLSPVQPAVQVHRSGSVISSRAFKSPLVVAVEVFSCFFSRLPHPFHILVWFVHTIHLFSDFRASNIPLPPECVSEIRRAFLVLFFYVCVFYCFLPFVRTVRLRSFRFEISIFVFRAVLYGRRRRRRSPRTTRPFPAAETRETYVFVTPRS